MRAKELSEFLEFAVKNQFPVLIKGRPGIGKSDIVAQAAVKAGAKLIISHPVVSDPTDYKGLPFVVDGKAIFLPFGELENLIAAKEPTIFFLDDLGQAPPSVQAACMQLLLARRINGHKVSDSVTFLAATNRREDKAAVSGILEPVKSRFASIIELDFNLEDWIKWAYQNGMPSELISFLQFRPTMLTDAKLSRDIVNSPSPRTMSYIGKMQNAALPQDLFFEAVKGAAGEVFAVEYNGYIQLYASLPTINEIIADPEYARLPDNIGSKYALIGMIADEMKINNITPLMRYLKRMPEELAMACVKNAWTKNPSIASTMEFIQWASKNAQMIM